MKMPFDQLHPEFAGTGIRRFQREEFVDGKNEKTNGEINQQNSAINPNFEEIKADDDLPF